MPSRRFKASQPLRSRLPGPPWPPHSSASLAPAARPSRSPPSPLPTLLQLQPPLPALPLFPRRRQLLPSLSVTPKAATTGDFPPDPTHSLD
ncbi:hypothetical protein BRADI_3g19275v3 [Brachypodium distachyon]|uniref:Uncharacterized protein n=1 Tax=Brachypodium distachyon TaxID=15368 RepID=A0A0Q3HQP4_BRADI|nr:hypothetical protein BRADI_3g19275v3 [Brachypodium distachyon]